MSDAYVGEIMAFAAPLTFIPVGWLRCDGSLQQISQYPELYSVIATTYGGDGNSTFALPDLRGRVAVGESPTYPLGQPFGVSQLMLTAAQTAHSHAFQVAAATADTNDPLPSPTGGGWPKIVATPSGSGSSKINAFAPYDPNAQVALSRLAVTVACDGINQQDNTQPIMGTNFIICCQGPMP
jgi:microcystin-dependent protein